jgi:hypothetical protein
MGQSVEILIGGNVPGRLPSSDEAIFHAAQKILGIGLRPFGGVGIIPVLERNFLQSDLRGIFGLKPRVTSFRALEEKLSESESAAGSPCSAQSCS